VTTDFAGLLRILDEASVRFILIGGYAASALGSPRVTLDLDVVYARDRANLDAIVSALSPLRPYLRGAPPGLPFRFDAETLRRGLNFTFETSAGALDILGEVIGGGTYEQLMPFTQDITLHGRVHRCVTVDKLIELKRAAGRPKDLEPIAELEVIREERARMKREWNEDPKD
jgi:predicted nucleotidyltransferase